MSLRVVREVIFVAMGDERFRHKLVFEPDETLEPYELTDKEFLALRLGDKDALVQMGIDENLATYAQMLFSKTR
jgi:hypothetical protein